MDEALTLPEEEMRRLGYALVDRMVEHAAGLRDLPPVRAGDAEQLMRALGGPPPDGPGDAQAELQRLLDEVVPFGQRGDHPRLFARISSPSNYVSALADADGRQVAHPGRVRHHPVHHRVPEAAHLLLGQHQRLVHLRQYRCTAGVRCGAGRERNG